MRDSPFFLGSSSRTRTYGSRIGRLAHLHLRRSRCFAAFPSLLRPPAALRERHPLTAGSQVRNLMPGDGGSAFSLHIAASFLLVPGGSSIRQAIALFYVTRLVCPVLPLCPVLDCHCLRFEKMHNLENESIWRVIIDKGRVLVRFISNFPISEAVERAGAHTKSR